MNSLVEKVLKSGLVDKDTVLYFEKVGVLPPGSTHMVPEDALLKASTDDKVALADELELLANKSSIKETMLDLDQIRWPAIVSVLDDKDVPVVHDLNCVVDRMGRFYFRMQEVESGWFVPGYQFRLWEKSREVRKVILESQTLSLGDVPVCVQVTVSSKP